MRRDRGAVLSDVRERTPGEYFPARARVRYRTVSSLACDSIDLPGRPRGVRKGGKAACEWPQSNPPVQGNRSPPESTTERPALRPATRWLTPFARSTAAKSRDAATMKQAGLPQLGYLASLCYVHQVMVSVTVSCFATFVQCSTTLSSLYCIFSSDGRFSYAK